MRKMRKWFGLLFFVVVITASGCRDRTTLPATQRQVQQQVQQRQATRDVYVPQHDVEFRNYNWRAEIADDPTTILWCTFFPPTVGQEPFTVPVIGKLSSSGKRPFPKLKAMTGGSSAYTYTPEEIQPDGMYGNSSLYRYGYGPQGRNSYMDFTDMPSFCTALPTVWQQNETRVVIQQSSSLRALTEQARKALAEGRSDDALELLGQAEGGQ